MRPDDGGPALPRSGYYPDTTDMRGDSLRERLPTITEPQEGLSLRDYFAAFALMGILANPHTFEQRLHPAEAAEGAYNEADAMLTRRRARS